MSLRQDRGTASNQLMIIWQVIHPHLSVKHMIIVSIENQRHGWGKSKCLVHFEGPFAQFSSGCELGFRIWLVSIKHVFCARNVHRLINSSLQPAEKGPLTVVIGTVSLNCTKWNNAHKMVSIFFHNKVINNSYRLSTPYLKRLGPELFGTLEPFANK